MQFCPTEEAEEEQMTSLISSFPKIKTQAYNEENGPTKRQERIKRREWKET